MVNQNWYSVQSCASQVLAQRKFGLLQPVKLIYTNEVGQTFTDQGIVTGFGLGPDVYHDEVWYQVTFFQMESSAHLALPYQEQVPESELEPLSVWNAAPSYSPTQRS